MATARRNEAEALPTAAGALPATAGRATLSGFVLFIAAAQFMVVTMIAGAMTPGYNLNGNTISDLGVVRATADAFNISLMAVGVLTMVGGWLLQPWHGRTWLLVLFGLAGVGAFGAGLVTQDALAFHSLSALLAFIGFNLLPAAIALITTGWIRLIALVAAVFGLAYLVLLVMGDVGKMDIYGAIGQGGTERMIVYPTMLWMLAFGGYLMADPRAPPGTGDDRGQPS